MDNRAHAMRPVPSWELLARALISPFADVQLLVSAFVVRDHRYRACRSRSLHTCFAAILSGGISFFLAPFSVFVNFILQHVSYKVGKISFFFYADFIQFVFHAFCYFYSHWIGLFFFHFYHLFSFIISFFVFYTIPY